MASKRAADGDAGSASDDAKRSRGEDADADDGEEGEEGEEGDEVPDTPDILPEETNVRILAGDHQGKCGMVGSYESDEEYEGCYGICLEDSEDRPTFCDRKSLLPRYEVTLVDLQSRADLNGKSATVEAFDRERQRYAIKLHDESHIKVSPANMLLPTGARVRIHGLVSAARHNGRLGKVIDYNSESGRYDVQFADAAGALSGVRLKRENVRL